MNYGYYSSLITFYPKSVVNQYFKCVMSWIHSSHTHHHIISMDFNHLSKMVMSDECFNLRGCFCVTYIYQWLQIVEKCYRHRSETYRYRPKMFIAVYRLAVVSSGGTPRLMWVTSSVGELALWKMKMLAAASRKARHKHKGWIFVFVSPMRKANAIHSIFPLSLI